jgi:hypothetical protein
LPESTAAQAPRRNGGDAVCPRCRRPFHSGAADDRPCWCTGIALGPGALAALSERYLGCLCGACLVHAAEHDLALPPD